MVVTFCDGNDDGKNDDIKEYDDICKVSFVWNKKLLQTRWVLGLTTIKANIEDSRITIIKQRL